MRNEKEMFALILGVADKDDRIRAVVMNGSRANANAKKDIFQDYDIGYIVDDVAPFVQNTELAAQFGDILIMQYPEESSLFPSEMCGCTMYLMQFRDGTRIDLNVGTLEMLKQRLAGPEQGEPMVALLDKDGILPELPGTSDAVYHVKPPSEENFRDCCNEFFWVQPYIAKALWRGQVPLAMQILNTHSRDMLRMMVDWSIGVSTGFSVSVGKNGAYYNQYLPVEIYTMYRLTYPPAEQDSIWNSVFTGCALFRALAESVARHFGFTYNMIEDENVIGFLHRIRALPQGADDIPE